MTVGFELPLSSRRPLVSSTDFLVLCPVWQDRSTLRTPLAARL